MAETISLSSTVAVAFYNTTDNPLSITGTGTIDAPGGVALDLESPIVWTLFNDGLVAISGASGTGVRLGAGGTIVNEAGGSIVGAGYGAFIAGGAGTVTNAGLVQSKGTLGIALTLLGGGVVDNDAGATITGGHAVEIGGAGGTLTNAGFISGYASAVYGNAVTNVGVITSSNTAGIQLIGTAAGTVTNATSATIAGGWGIIDTLHAAAIDNGGLISGSAFDSEGIFLAAGGTVSNASGGTITGYLYGVDIENGVQSLINAGTVTATGTLNGVAVSTTFGGAAYVGNTGSIIGSKAGVGIKSISGSVNNSGLIEGGTGYGVALPSGDVTNARGGVIRGGLSSIVYLGGFGTVTNAGTIEAAVNPSMTSNAVLFRNGYADRLIADPGAVFVGTVNGGNSIGASAVSVLELAPGVGSIATVTNFGSIVFDPGAAWTISSSTSALAMGELISGFAPGDTIELAGAAASKTGLVGDTLELTGGLNVILPGNTYSYAQFGVTNAGGNTDITVACFVAGTRILTDAGEVAVEALRPGMRVVSLTHRRPVPVKWIGSRTVPRAAPVRIEEGAFGAALPHRSLHLSPDHAVCIDDTLIPVRHLVNGSSIAPVTCPEVPYFHVELHEHAVLLAEGLPAESYLDTDNRAAFASAPRRLDSATR